MTNINRHTCINEDGNARPRHAQGTCEICNVYWNKAFDLYQLRHWIDGYHKQGQEFLRDKLKDPEAVAKVMTDG